jgi:hypothetical protein
LQRAVRCNRLLASRSRFLALHQNVPYLAGVMRHRPAVFGVQPPDLVMNKPPVYRGELGEANGRSPWQTDLGPAAKRDIRRITRRVCGHAGNQEVNIADNEQQPRSALMGL